MCFFRLTTWCAAALVAASFLFGLSFAEAYQIAPPTAEEGVEVLTRGPVHEAFAETIAFDPDPGVIAPKVPPAAIEESPPEQRPEGTNVAWISGYWAWDDERKDFLWVSGIWRALPPGRQWVPGYWARSGAGAQWTSGYWADAKLEEVEYLPEPPASVEAGPNVAATSADQQWLPGTWVWQQNRYAWRPGHVGHWPSGLGLCPGSLCLVAARLCVCRWLLRPFAGPSRRAFRAGLFSLDPVPTAGIFLLPVHGY